MKEFVIYEHPSGDIKAVKKGWSHPAFWLDGFWALYHDLTPQAVTGIALTILSLLGVVGTNWGGALGLLGVSVYYGIKGNDWLKEKLIKSGYVSKCSLQIQSNSKREAGKTSRANSSGWYSKRSEQRCKNLPLLWRTNKKDCRRVPLLQQQPIRAASYTTRSGKYRTQCTYAS